MYLATSQSVQKGHFKMSNSQIKALFDQRSNAASELRSVYDAAGESELSAEQTQTEERLNGAIAVADERISALLTLASGEEAARSAHAELGAVERQSEVAEARSDNDRLRSVGKGEARGEDFGYEARGTATLVAGTAGVGGNTVPTSFYDTLMESLAEFSTVIAANATVLNTAGGEAIQIPTATAFPTASLVSENTQIGTQDATFGQKTLNAYKYAFVMKASSELLNDTGINLVEFLGRQGGAALGSACGAAAITGTGSSQPQGIIAASGGLGTTASGTGSVAAGFVGNDLVNAVHGITRPYRDGSVWIMNDSTVKTLRKLKDLNGQYVWQGALAAGEPDTILGYPVFTDPAMPTAQTNGVKGLVFGNINKAVMVRFAGPVRVEASTDFAFDYDLMTWRFIVRFDSEVIDTAAATALTYTT
jgi:HK97 family phage major capsid protein